MGVEFKKFKLAIQKQFKKISKYKLFTVEVNKDTLWNTYINSFPEGTNPAYKERTRHDCQCCKQFIRKCGNVVALVNNKPISIWDIKIEDQYQIVADALSNLVKSNKIDNLFLHYEKNIGTDHNRQLLDNNEIITWSHFYCELPRNVVHKKNSIDTYLSKIRSNKDVFKRGCSEISLDSAFTVLELIGQKSIYRGEEHRNLVKEFILYKNRFDKLKSNQEKENYCWDHVASNEAFAIRNTVIGTLLIDISDGMDLDKAVKVFESKVTPANYKRPTALVTKSMISNAQKKVQKLGIEDSLTRRYAVTEDITINNILFANRDTKKIMNVFDELAQDAHVKLPNFDKIDEIDIDTFISTILPKINNIEILFEYKHINNLVSLIAPQYNKSKHIFKWDNNFSWSYNGEVTDSIKERVKKAGGNVTGVLRSSLAWFNYDDLDIHTIEPDGNHIYFSRKGRHPSSGILDVDMNVHDKGSRNAVENITWSNKSKMQEGEYRVYVHNYTPRESTDVGFDVEIEHDNIIHTFHYGRKVLNNVEVATFNYTHKKGIEFIKSLPATKASKEEWGISTNKFQKVSMVMNSPNHWNKNETGNKHWFFIIENCRNDKQSRGFYNEFLKEELREHRKVFEILGSKMKIECSNNQLSGLGFSSTQRSQIICKVSGKFTRVIKINF